MGYVSLVELAGFVADHSSWRVDCMLIIIAQLTARLLLANHFRNAPFVVALTNWIKGVFRCFVPNHFIGDCAD